MCKKNVQKTFHTTMNDKSLRTTNKKAAGNTSPAARTGRPKVRPDALAAAAVQNEPDGDDIIQRIYQTVFASVMSQRLTPGTKWPDAALCELFGVGRTVVQKALQKLAHEHIVELRPNRGAIVAM